MRKPVLVGVVTYSAGGHMSTRTPHSKLHIAEVYTGEWTRGTHSTINAEMREPAPAVVFLLKHKNRDLDINPCLSSRTVFSSGRWAPTTGMVPCWKRLSTEKLFLQNPPIRTSFRRNWRTTAPIWVKAYSHYFTFRCSFWLDVWFLWQLHHLLNCKKCYEEIGANLYLYTKVPSIERPASAPYRLQWSLHSTWAQTK